MSIRSVNLSLNTYTRLRCPVRLCCGVNGVKYTQLNIASNQKKQKNKKTTTKKQQQHIYIYIHINTLISSRFVLRAAAVRPGNVMCILITSHVMLCNANGFYLRKWVKDSRSDVKLHTHCNAKPTSLSYITYIVHIML